MSRKELKQSVEVHINSLLDRKPTETDAYKWTSYLSHPMRTSNNIKCSLKYIELPNTSYPFPIYEKQFFWIHDYGGANTLKNISIDTQRVYDDIDDLKTELNNKMSAGGHLLSFDVVAKTYKLKLTNNEAVAIRVVSINQFENVAGVVNSVTHRIGFNLDYSTVSIPAASTLIASDPVNLLRSNCYYIKCNLISNRHTQNVIPNPFNNGQDILGRVTATSFGVMSQLSYTTDVEYDVNTNIIDALQFEVLDDNFKPVELSYSTPITMTILFTLS